MMTAPEPKVGAEVVSELRRMAAEIAEVDGNVEQLATFSRGTRETFGKVSSDARNIAEASEQILNQAEDGQGRIEGAAKTASSTLSSFQELVDASSQIQGVVALVTEIASQTRLLALNATIEAARAGELGKGFAVVASEVKSLAQETERSTVRITDEIQRVNALVEKASEAIEAIESDLSSAMEVSSLVAEAVRTQRHATQTLAQEVGSGARDADHISDILEVISKNVGRHRDESAELVRMTESWTQR